MGRGSPTSDDGPAVVPILEALNDEDCRKIVKSLSNPMTAEEISDATGIPLSTTYRKLDRLTEASLIEEGVEVRSDGQHVSRYLLVFDEVSITLNDEQGLDVELSRDMMTADERLAALWSEVRKET